MAFNSRIPNDAQILVGGLIFQHPFSTWLWKLLEYHCSLRFIYNRTNTQAPETIHTSVCALRPGPKRLKSLIKLGKCAGSQKFTDFSVQNDPLKGGESSSWASVRRQAHAGLMFDRICLCVLLSTEEVKQSEGEEAEEARGKGGYGCCVR